MGPDRGLLRHRETTRCRRQAQGDAVRRDAADLRPVQVAGTQNDEDGVEDAQKGKLTYQHDVQHAVVHARGGLDAHTRAVAGAVGDRSEQYRALPWQVVCLHPQFDGAVFPQRPQRGRNVTERAGQAAKTAVDQARGLRVESQATHGQIVMRCTVAEARAQHIHRLRLAADKLHGCSEGIERQIEPAGDVVAVARGEEGEVHAGMKRSVNGVVHGAIATQHGDDLVTRRRGVAGKILQVLFARRFLRVNLHAVLAQQVQYARGETARLAAAGDGVDDEQRISTRIHVGGNGAIVTEGPSSVNVVLRTAWSFVRSGTPYTMWRGQ